MKVNNLRNAAAIARRKRKQVSDVVAIENDFPPYPVERILGGPGTAETKCIVRPKGLVAKQRLDLLVVIRREKACDSKVVQQTQRIAVDRQQRTSCRARGIPYRRLQLRLRRKKMSCCLDSKTMVWAQVVVIRSSAGEVTQGIREVCRNAAAINILQYSLEVFTAANVKSLAWFSRLFE